MIGWNVETPRRSYNDETLPLIIIPTLKFTNEITACRTKKTNVFTMLATADSIREFCSRALEALFKETTPPWTFSSRDACAVRTEEDGNETTIDRATGSEARRAWGWSKTTADRAQHLFRACSELRSPATTKGSGGRRTAADVEASARRHCLRFALAEVAPVIAKSGRSEGDFSYRMDPMERRQLLLTADNVDMRRGDLRFQCFHMLVEARRDHRQRKQQQQPPPPPQNHTVSSTVSSSSSLSKQPRKRTRNDEPRTDLAREPAPYRPPQTTTTTTMVPAESYTSLSSLMNDDEFDREKGALPPEPPTEPCPFYQVPPTHPTTTRWREPERYRDEGGDDGKDDDDLRINLHRDQRVERSELSDAIFDRCLNQDREALSELDQHFKQMYFGRPNEAFRLLPKDEREQLERRRAARTLFPNLEQIRRPDGVVTFRYENTFERDPRYMTDFELREEYYRRNPVALQTRITELRMTEFVGSAVIDGTMVKAEETDTKRLDADKCVSDEICALVHLQRTLLRSSSSEHVQDELRRRMYRRMRRRRRLAEARASLGPAAAVVVDESCGE